MVIVGDLDDDGRAEVALAHHPRRRLGAPCVPPDTDPEVTDPGVTDPGVTDPEVTDPEVTDPEVTDPR